MNPHYLVDGYNFIHYIPRFRNFLDISLEQARNALIHFMRNYQSRRKVKITIVFDGDEVGYIEKQPASSRWLKVIYSRPPEKADPMIKKVIQKAKSKKSLILVTLDNELIGFGNQHGLQVLSPEEFYQRASKTPILEQVDRKYNSQISEDEVDEWLKLFGEKGE